MSTSTHRKTFGGLALLLVLAAMLALAPGAMAKGELQLASRFGGAVDATTGGNICTVESGDTCTYGSEGTAAGWFSNGSAVAVDRSSGDVYVVEQVNKRAQKFDSEGHFILMFGAEVNETKDSTPGATEAEKNLCTAASGDVCKAGAAGSGAGQFSAPTGVSVEESTGDVYVTDYYNNRVDKYTSDGEFILAFGWEVNGDGSNVCLAGETCKAGVLGTGSGQFEEHPYRIAVGSVGGTVTVYVGANKRSNPHLDEFEPSGAWKASVSTAAISTGEIRQIAVDSSGDLYITVGGGGSGGVHKCEVVTNGAGELECLQVREFDTGGMVYGIAIAPSGNVAVWDCGVCNTELPGHGYLYKPSGEFISNFGEASVGSTGGALAFNASEELYVADLTGGSYNNTLHRDVQIFRPFGLPTASICSAKQVGAKGATLCGEVNPEGIDASSFFEYGACATLATCSTSAYGETVSAVQGAGGPNPGSPDAGSGEANVPVEASVAELVPNQAYHYRLLGHNTYGNSPPSAEESFTTSAIPPEEVKTLPPSSVGFEAAALTGSLNPEHSQTAYRFEYGLCETSSTCSTSPYTSKTPVLESSLYGTENAFAEIEGLQPSSTYHYRLLAENSAGPAVYGPEEAFTTEPTPVLLVTSGTASAITQTAAVISGTLEPNGVATSYGFQIAAQDGAYGPEIGFGRLGGGLYEASTVRLALQNLQPGTTYRYRLLASNSYNPGVYGTDRTFTTAPAAPTFTQPPATALMPFRAAPPSCRRGYRHDRHGRCVRKQRHKRHRHHRRAGANR